MSTLDQGWAVIRNGSCLASSEVDCGATKTFHTCCPTGYQCHQNTLACCLPGNDCTGALAAAATPRCADSTWRLFNHGGYFCCGANESGYSSGNTDGCAKNGVKPDGSNTMLSVVGAEKAKPTDATSTDTSSTGTSSTGTSSTGTSSTGTSSSRPKQSQTSKANSSHTSSPSPSPSSSSTPVGAIVGGVIGGIVFLALVGVLAWFLLRRRKQAKAQNAYAPKPPEEMSSNVPSTLPSAVDTVGTEYGMEGNPTPPPASTVVPGAVEADGAPVQKSHVELPAIDTVPMGSEQRPVELPTETSPVRY